MTRHTTPCSPSARSQCRYSKRPKAKARPVVLLAHKLSALATAVRSPDLLPDRLTPAQSATLGQRIGRFLAGFTTPAGIAGHDDATLPVAIPRHEFLTLRRRWLALVCSASGLDRAARRRATERVRDFFKRHFKPTP